MGKIEKKKNSGCIAKKRTKGVKPMDEGGGFLRRERKSVGTGETFFKRKKGGKKKFVGLPWEGQKTNQSGIGHKGGVGKHNNGISKLQTPISGGQVGKEKKKDCRKQQVTGGNSKESGRSTRGFEKTTQKPQKGAKKKKQKLVKGRKEGKCRGVGEGRKIKKTML